MIQSPSIKSVFALLLMCLSLVAMPAQLSAQSEDTSINHTSTGGGQSLEDILARQRGEKVEDSFRRAQDGSANIVPDMAGQLGTLGGASDADVFRSIRFGTADITVSAGGPVAEVLIQDGGMKWLAFRAGPLMQYGGYFLVTVLIVLALYYFVHGKIRIDAGESGVTITRFKAVERFGHWLLASSFILLGLTGLWMFFGRKLLIPVIGKDAFSSVAIVTKWVHNNIAWSFMLALIIVLVMWLRNNIPNKNDIKWLMVGGGMFSKGVHPPARKFNAGQKIFFWLVILLGASVSLSGLSMLFPFELPMFAKAFSLANSAAGLVGIDVGLPAVLAPQEEMQFSQMWHVIAAVLMIGVIFGHIYIGSIGMQGAFAAMGSGEVDRNWAKEHHSLWVAEADAEAAANAAKVPAE